MSEVTDAEQGGVRGRLGIYRALLFVDKDSEPFPQPPHFSDLRILDLAS